MIDVIFLASLYGLGLWVGSALFPSLSLPFIAWTSLLWGGLIWTTGVILYFVLGVEVSILAMLIWCGAFALVACIIHIRYPSRHLDKPAIIQTGLIFFAFIGVLFISKILGLAYVSYDSLIQLILAEGLASGDISNDLLQRFGERSPMLPALHLVAFWSGTTVFITIQTAFGFTIIGTLGHLCHRVIQPHYDQLKLLRWIPLLASLLLATTYFFAFQLAYIHNSILATAYLLPAVVLLWLAHVEQDEGLLYPALILFMGFALTRTESVLFAGLFIVLAVAYDRFRSRTWWIAMSPYVIVSLGWQLWLLVGIRADTGILNPERILLLVGAIIGAYMSPLMVLPPLKRLLLGRIRNLMLYGMAFVLFALMLIDPNNILGSILNSFSNLMLGGIFWWGLIWYFVALSMFMLRKSGKIEYGQLLSYGILGFFFLTWLIGFARDPYRLGWGDSANRMYTHILPIALFYIAIRLSRYLISPVSTNQSDSQMLNAD